MLARIVGDVRFKEPLSFYTSLRIGGPAEFFIVPQDLDDVRYALAFAAQEGLPLMVLGGGNNVLFSDQTIHGIVLKLGGILSRAEFQGEEVAVGAGMSLSGLIREAAARDMGGLECLAGIPATIGGALAMNAGTRDGSIFDFCTAIYYVHRDGTFGEYRHMAHTTAQFDLPSGAILAGCRLRLVRRPVREIQRNIQQRMKARKATQPFALASAGYIWKNPAGQSAERLIDSVGMRGKRINGAEVSVKCSNLIVNRATAGPDDVLALMSMTRARVGERYGITLQTEIRLLGMGTAAESERHELAMAGGR
jgi:UDP-N-acetylmuramate dehydrogenase